MVMFIFVLIGKMYTIGVAMQMNIFEKKNDKEIVF